VTPDLPSHYRINLFTEQHVVTAADVVALWGREGGLSVAEAQRRVAELLLVATERDGELVGVCTVYLRHNIQLRTPMWHLRVFVAAAHRRSELATSLALAARDHLSRRFAGGQDRRAIGLISEVQSEVLKRYRRQAVWPSTGFVFIGENARGDHVRVHYFPGALSPEPDQGSA
jgi:Acetyltransferase (GNAT) family